MVFRINDRTQTFKVRRFWPSALCKVQNVADAPSSWPCTLRPIPCPSAPEDSQHSFLRDPKVPAQIRVHLRHRAPTAFLEPFLHRLPCLGADAVGPTGVVGPAVLEQGFDPAQTVGIEPLLNGGTGVADGAGDNMRARC